MRKVGNGLDLNGQRIQNQADPSSPSDSATKQYVDNLVNGLAWKALPVRAATTANITLSGTQTIDGVALAVNDRVLVMNQTVATANGIYVVAAGAWTRSTDADSPAELLNATVLVSEGTVNADKAFTQTANAPIVVGTTNLPWGPVGGGVSYTAGNGIGLTGTTFSVTPAASGGISVGGGGVSVDTAVVVRKFSQNIGDGTATSIVVTHNLGTTDVTVGLYDNGTKAEFDTDVFHTDANNVTVVFPTAPGAGAYRIVIHG